MISKFILEIKTSTEVQQYLNFLSEQLTVLFIHPEGRKYSKDMLICAFACLNRGGFIYPYILLFNIIRCSYSIVNMCVSSSLESSFIKFENQIQTLVEQYISNTDGFLAVYYACEECDSTLLTYLVNALGCFSNILLNNYSKIHTDKLGHVNQSTKLSH